MKIRLLADLVCPLSSHPLQLVGDEPSDDVEVGELFCTGCQARWAIQSGVPRLVPPDLAEQQRKTAAAFGFEWRHFDEMHREYEGQFLDWLHPIGPAFFRDKRVLDVGCGTGRHARLAALYGASEVIALDLSEAVETARRVLSPFGGSHVVQGDLLRPPFRTAADGGGFDFVYCIGVLHHLPDSYEGFRALLPLVRPGGTIAVWVYGYENTGLVRKVVEPMRRLTTKVPPSLLRGVAWPLGAAFHGAAKGVYRPLAGIGLDRALPLSEYMTSVANFSFSHNYSIVFDQLVAPTAAYIKGPDLRQWFEMNSFEDVHVSHRHGSSWRGYGRAPRIKTSGCARTDADGRACR
jgi:SAM-dependent methyltransferase